MGHMEELEILPVEMVKHCVNHSDSDTSRSFCHDLVDIVRQLRQFIETHGDLSQPEIDAMTAEFWFGVESVFSSARRLLGTKPEDVESAFCMLVTECRCSPDSALAAVETLVGVNSCMPNRFKKSCLERCTNHSQQLRSTWEQQCSKHSVCSPDVFAWTFR